MKSLVTLSALCAFAAAHFTLTYPPSIGFEDADEDKAPCGGFTPDFTKDLVDFHVGGEAIAVRLMHPQCNWLFRVTTDEKAASGWEQIFPIVQQSGLGDFCEPQVTVPESYVGKKGVVGVVSSAVDGLLYQCIAVNFVPGSAEPPSKCKNGTIKASFVADASLSALVGKSADGAAEGTSTTTAAAAAATTSKSAASTMALGWSSSLAALFILALGGALYN
ncbi:GPI anchored protein [Drechmeria coniospora]|uniref:GPI anchored protein n=1 Tax=Drechmeria coniospora TaxID=98403 RepID=A0A151GH22_DRECN|nr:GPI anchored protein [Drechmeria coniospora]KYK56366.1 GPI anchored protein [Drechmeria coniospora]ODA76816.1 hypothetical protein RJ55_07332 [Drechmeria coniospora]